MEVWILTFDRPDTLNRLVANFAKEGQKVNIFTNHPELRLTDDNNRNVDQIIFNNLNSSESNAWCARSWNTILMKAFDDPNVEDAILIQDDTDIAPGFMNWINEQRKTYHFIWGPAGDQFHYIHRDVLKKVGWWDERYIGCYCGDADYMKRVYIEYPKKFLSIVDTHNWGFIFNDCGLRDYVITTYESKTIGENYENQHWQFERIDKANPTILHSQQHYQAKWGTPLDNNKPLIHSTVRLMNEIDWYPWFSKKHNFKDVRHVSDFA